MSDIVSIERLLRAYYGRHRRMDPEEHPVLAPLAEALSGCADRATWARAIAMVAEDPELAEAVAALLDADHEGTR